MLGKLEFQGPQHRFAFVLCGRPCRMHRPHDLTTLSRGEGIHRMLTAYRIPSGDWLTFDFFLAGNTTTEATALFGVFERACAERRRRVRIPSADSLGNFLFVLMQRLIAAPPAYIPGATFRQQHP